MPGVVLVGRVLSQTRVSEQATSYLLVFGLGQHCYFADKENVEQTIIILYEYKYEYKYKL